MEVSTAKGSKQGSKKQEIKDKLDRCFQEKLQQLSSEPKDDGKARRELSEPSEDNGIQCKSQPARRPCGRPVMLCRLPLHLASKDGGTPNNLQNLQTALEDMEVGPRNSNIGREGSGSPKKG